LTQTAHKTETVPTAQQTDLSLIKSKMKATWEDGDYAAFAE